MTIQHIFALCSLNLCTPNASKPHFSTCIARKIMQKFWFFIHHLNVAARMVAFSCFISCFGIHTAYRRHHGKRQKGLEVRFPLTSSPLQVTRSAQIPSSASPVLSSQSCSHNSGIFPAALQFHSGLLPRRRLIHIGDR